MSQNYDSKALFKLGYGLYLLTSNNGSKDNGMILNTAVQVASSPAKISVSINKENYTHDIVKETGIMNISCLTQDTPFEVFKHFGFQSGKTTDKFEGKNPARSENGLVYAKNHANSYISLKTVQYLDLGSHGMFICDITDAKVLSDKPSLTYDYYHKNIKPKNKPSKKKGFVCKICGYIYEGDTLPEDFVCPICKHPASDFEKIADEDEKPKKYKCTVCGYIYEGDTLPDDFVCPICGVPASKFEPI